jgi:WD40 repeat protein
MHKLKVLFKRSDIELMREWYAHDDSISQINFIQEQKLLISSSFDCIVRIWSLKGEKLGSLIVGNDPRWKLDSYFEMNQYKKWIEA